VRDSNDFSQTRKSEQKAVSQWSGVAGSRDVRRAGRGKVVSKHVRSLVTTVMQCALLACFILCTQ